MAFLKTIGIVFALNILEFFIAPVSNAIVTKSLSVEHYGIYGYIGAVISFATTFFALGLGMFNYAMIPGKEEGEQYHYLGRTLFIELVVTLLGGVIISMFLAGDLLKYSLLAVFFIRLVVVVVNSEIMRFLGYQKRNILKAIIGFFDARLWLLPLVLWVFVAHLNLSSLFWIQTGSSIAAMLGMLFMIKPGKFLANLRPDRAVLIKGIKFSLPLILVDLGQYLLDMGNRYVLRLYLTYTEVGLYGFVATWIGVIYKFGMLLVYVLQPYIAESNTKGEQESCRSLISLAIKYMYLFTIVASIGFVVNYHDIVLLLGKSDYLVTHRTALIMSFYPVLIGVAYLLQILGVLRGGIKKLPLIYLISAAANIACNFIFIPLVGYDGAAISTVLGYAVLVVLMYRLVRDPYGAVRMLVKDLRILVVIPVAFLVLNGSGVWLQLPFFAILGMNGALLLILILTKAILTGNERKILHDAGV